MEEFKNIIIRIISIFLIAFIPCTALLFVYFFTSPIIKEYRELKEKRAVLDSFNIPYRITEKNILGFTYKSYDKENIKDVFDKNITTEMLRSEISEEKKKVYKYIKDGELQGIGFVSTKTGYGYNQSNPWSIFICLEPDLKTIKGIEVLEHSETPGLGGRMTEEEYKNQFVGKKVQPRIEMVKDGKATANNEFDAITGATNTSRGIENFLNDAMKEFDTGVE